MLSRRFKPAIEELEETIRLNPNFALGHMVLGAAHGFGGAGDGGLQHLALGMRLSPRDPHQAFYLTACGICHFVAGRDQECATLNRRAVLLRPRFTSAWRSLAASAGIAGETETATTALAKTRQLQPELSIDWVGEASSNCTLGRPRYLHRRFAYRRVEIGSCRTTVDVRFGSEAEIIRGSIRSALRQ